MMENFPYFKTAPDGWKNSVRHNLSLNKCFEKVEKPNGSQRKGCLWALNPAKATKMEEELQKWKRKDPESIRKSMSNPEEFDREMEELRKSDEEAARRRLMGLANRGLPIISPPFPHHHQSPYHHQHFHQQQHYHHQQLQINHHQQHIPTNNFHQQQQHNNFATSYSLQQQFGQPIQQHQYYGNHQQQNQLLNHQQAYAPVEMTNPHQTATTNTGFLDSIQTGDELNDLESSLGDLAAFQTDQFFAWNESNGATSSNNNGGGEVSDAVLTPNNGAGGGNSGEMVFNSNQPQQRQQQQILVNNNGGGTLPSLTLPEPPNSAASGGEKCGGEDDEFDDNNPLTRFTGDFSYITTNNKTVMLH